MPSEGEIIEALQFEIFYESDAINGSGDSPYTITFQFEDSDPADNISAYTGWSAWNDAERNSVRAALEYIETFLNIDFVEVTSNADPDLNLGQVALSGSTAGVGGISVSYAGTTITRYDGFALFDIDQDLNDNTSLILHELGHALGLDHPFEGVPLDEDYDNSHYTLMSYDEDPESGEDNDAMMIFDILALQDIWGAAEHNTGDTTYTGPRTDNVDTIWDTGGTDTFDALARNNGVKLDLREGAYSTFGNFEDVAIAFGVTIENAIGGAGDDKLTGNDADNALWGNNGDDLIRGKAGADTLKGMSGADELKGGNGDDKLKGGSGADKVYGGGGDDMLQGGSGDDKLWGEAGEDTFCFKSGAERDVVRDYERGVDTIEIIGLGMRAEVLARADERNGNVFFEFDDGDTLVIKNTTLDAVESDLSIA